MTSHNGSGLFTVHTCLTTTPTRPLIFIIQGRYQNWIKPLMLLSCLSIPHDVLCLPSTRTEWYRQIHPQQMAPGMVDECEGKRLCVWDSSSCLWFVAKKYDETKSWVGRDLREEVEVWNWLTFETSALGYVVMQYIGEREKLTSE